MANQLIPFWDEEKTDHEKREDRAKAELEQAGAELKAATQAHVAKRHELLALDAEIAKTRARHAAANVPSESTALNKKLTELTEQRRRLDGAVLDVGALVPELQERAEAAKRRLAQAVAGKAGANSARDRAGTDVKQRGELAQALRSAPLSTIPADAQAALNADAADAKQFVDTIPPELTTLAEKRYRARVDLIELRTQSAVPFRGAITEANAADAKFPGELERAVTRLRLAEGAAQDFKRTAPTRLKSSKAVLHAFAERQRAGAGQALLTPAEQEDAKVNTERSKAAEEAAKVTDELEKLFAAETQLEDTWRAHVAVDPDTAADQSQAELEAVAHQRQTLAYKAAEFDGTPHRKVLDDWQVVIPDTAWAEVLAYLEAHRELKALSTEDPAALAATLEAREDALAIALRAAKKAERRNAVLADQVALRELRSAAASAERPARALSALRGDTY